MRIPLSIIGKLAAKLVVWIAPRLDKSPHEILVEAGAEVVKEVERRAVPSRTTIAAPVPFVPDQPPSQ